MPVKYIKIYKDGAWQKIEEDRLERFLSQGWSLGQEEKSLSKDKISVSAEVTSKEVVEEEHEEDLYEDEEVCPECDEDPCVCDDDELPTNEEN